MKTEVVRVRLTGLEKNKLCQYAEGLNMSMSDYIKYCCLVDPRHLRTEDEETEDRLSEFLL